MGRENYVPFQIPMSTSVFAFDNHRSQLMKRNPELKLPLLTFDVLFYGYQPLQCVKLKSYYHPQPLQVQRVLAKTSTHRPRPQASPQQS